MQNTQTIHTLLVKERQGWIFKFKDTINLIPFIRTHPMTHNHSSQFISQVI